MSAGAPSEPLRRLPDRVRLYSPLAATYESDDEHASNGSSVDPARSPHSAGGRPRESLPFDAPQLADERCEKYRGKAATARTSSVVNHELPGHVTMRMSRARSRPARVSSSRWLPADYLRQDRRPPQTGNPGAAVVPRGTDLRHRPHEHVLWAVDVLGPVSTMMACARRRQRFEQP
jgi:hypothetical protein